MMNVGTTQNDKSLAVQNITVKIEGLKNEIVKHGFTADQLIKVSLDTANGQVILHFVEGTVDIDTKASLVMPETDMPCLLTVTYLPKGTAYEVNDDEPANTSAWEEIIEALFFVKDKHGQIANDIFFVGRTQKRQQYYRQADTTFSLNPTGNGICNVRYDRIFEKLYAIKTENGQAFFVTANTKALGKDTDAWKKLLQIDTKDVILSRPKVFGKYTRFVLNETETRHRRQIVVKSIETRPVADFGKSYDTPYIVVCEANDINLNIGFQDIGNTFEVKWEMSNPAMLPLA